jgi:hypothetical protein
LFFILRGMNQRIPFVWRAVLRNFLYLYFEAVFGVHGAAPGAFGTGSKRGRQLLLNLARLYILRMWILK